MSAEEAADTLIVVFVAETSRRNVDAVVGPFEAEFGSQIHSGLIELIGPPTEGLYPDFDKVEATLGDSDVSELKHSEVGTDQNSYSKVTTGDN